MRDLTPEALDVDARAYYQTLAQDEWLETRTQLNGVRCYEKYLQGRILQMGYGTGAMARLLSEGRDFSVIEGSPILAAHARADWLQVIEGMFEDFDDFGEEPYDTVLAGHVLEHVDDPERIMGLVRGWLAPAGVAIFIVPNAKSLHRTLGRHMGFGSEYDLSPRDHLVGHQRVYDLDGLEDDARAAGFSVVDAFGWFVKSVPNAAMLGWPVELIDGLCSWDWPPDECANIGIVARKV